MGVIWSDLEAWKSCSCILDSLKSIKKVLRYTREQSITTVQSGKYNGRYECFGGIDGELIRRCSMYAAVKYLSPVGA